MRSNFHKIFLQFSGIFLALPLGAQILRVDPVPGRDGSVTLELASPSGKEPAALQWDFSVPDKLLIEVDGGAAGKAAQNARNGIQCRMQVNLPGEKNRFVPLPRDRRCPSHSQWSGGDPESALRDVSADIEILK